MKIWVLGFVCGFVTCLLVWLRRHTELLQALKAANEQLQVAQRELDEADKRERRLAAQIMRVHAMFRRLMTRMQERRVSASVDATRHDNEKGRNPDVLPTTEPRPGLHERAHYTGND